MLTSGRPLGGRIALVTGGNHGIGAAVAVALAQSGADVAATYLRSAASQDPPDQPPAYSEQRRLSAALTTAAVLATGARAHDIEADLADPATPGRLFDEVEAELGRYRSW